MEPIVILLASSFMTAYGMYYKIVIQKLYNYILFFCRNHGEKHGTGKFTVDKYSTFSGDFVDGEITGKGCYILCRITCFKRMNRL